MGDYVDIATIVVAFLAVLITSRIARQQRNASSFNVMSYLLAEFDEEKTKQARASLARNFPNYSDSMQDDADIVLRCVEHMCTSIRRGSVDQWTLWASSVGDRVFSYGAWLQGHIENRRRADNTMYEDTLWFLKKWNRRTRRRRLINALFGCHYRSRTTRIYKRNEELIAASIIKDVQAD